MKKWRNQRCLNVNYSQKGIETFVWQYGKNGFLKNACFAKTATVYHTYVWGNFVAHGSNSHKMYFTEHPVRNFVSRSKMEKYEFQNLIVFFETPCSRDKSKYDNSLLLYLLILVRHCL